MKTKTIELYEFDELSDDAKAKVLENERDINVDDSHWYQFVYEMWEEKLEAMGFEEPKINFSGFWSQGDGASFTCKNVDIEKFLTTQKAKGRFKATIKALERDVVDVDINFSVDRLDHRYSHEYTVTVNSELVYISDPDNDHYLAMETEEGELRNFILETVRTLSRKIYKDLESEYEGLTSDEAVIDTIKANEYTFTANGKMENA